MTAATAKTERGRKPPSTSKPGNPVRAGLVGKVHVARQQLGLDDDSYRDLLERVTGKRSAAALSISDLEAVVAEFRALGWKPARRGPVRAGTRPLATTATAGKLRALWLDGWHLGVVQDPSEAALSAWVKRVTGGRRRGIDALQWLTEDDAAKAIEGLKAWLTREAGVCWDAYRDPITREVWYDPARRVVEAQARLLGLTWRQALGVGGHVGWFAVSAAEATAVVEALGVLLRAAQGRAS